jgi:hypothetical protein
MKLIAAAGLIVVIGLAALGTREAGLWGSDDPVATSPPRVAQGALGLGGEVPDPGPSGSACLRLAALAERLGEEATDERQFLRRLGREAAGIHTGARALLDLARGGTDILPGGGFRAPFSDGTSGQARHFAGIAVAASYGGGEATRTISIFARGDPPSSADGRLTEAALAFERALRRGELATADAGAWILGRICRPSGS